MFGSSRAASLLGSDLSNKLAEKTLPIRARSNTCGGPSQCNSAPPPQNMFSPAIGRHFDRGTPATFTSKFGGDASHPSCGYNQQ